MDDRDTLPPLHVMPTRNRPLIGHTVLVVEDSRYASEAVRLLSLRSGARIRRADCLKSARRHLQIYRPSIMIIDLGLPDGSGLGLIEELACAVPRVPVILASSGDDNTEAAALAAGADGFLAKPILSLAAFQQAVLSQLPPESRPPGPQSVSDERIEPDALAYQDDMAYAADVLADLSDDRALDYAAQFIGGVARCADDADLARAADELVRTRAIGAPVAQNAARFAGLVQQRTQRNRAI